jgi:excisionase family DNA binding protein
MPAEDLEIGAHAMRMTVTIDIADVELDGRAIDVGRVLAATAHGTLGSTAVATQHGDDGDGAVFVSIAEAANRLGIGKTFVYQMVARDELPTRQFGRRRLVPVAALHRLAEES